MHIHAVMYIVCNQDFLFNFRLRCIWWKCISIAHYWILRALTFSLPVLYSTFFVYLFCVSPIELIHTWNIRFTIVFLSIMAWPAEHTGRNRSFSFFKEIWYFEQMKRIWSLKLMWYGLVCCTKFRMKNKILS